MPLRLLLPPPGLACQARRSLRQPLPPRHQSSAVRRRRRSIFIGTLICLAFSCPARMIPLASEIRSTLPRFRQLYRSSTPPVAFCGLRDCSKDSQRRSRAFDAFANARLPPPDLLLAVVNAPLTTRARTQECDGH